MITDKTVKEFGFKRLPSPVRFKIESTEGITFAHAEEPLEATETQFDRYYKTYDEIGLVIIFDRLTGELFGFDLGGSDRVAAFVLGELVIKVFGEYVPSPYLAEIVTLAPFDLCRAVNLSFILTLGDLRRALEAVEKNIEYTILNPFLSYHVGDRVIYKNGTFQDIGQVESIDTTTEPVKYYLKMSNGKHIVTRKDGFLSSTLSSRKKFDLYTFKPGEK